MEIQTTKIEKLEWHYDQFGTFIATVVDNQLSNVELYRVAGQYNGALVTDDLEYVKAVYHALGELLKHIDRDSVNIITPAIDNRWQDPYPVQTRQALNSLDEYTPQP